MQKIKGYITAAGLLCLFGYLGYKVINRVNTNHLLETKAEHVKAVIINKKNYMGNSPVSHEYSYSYTFTVNGKNYEGNSHDSNLKIGDSVEVEFVKNSPDLNKPLHPAE